MGNDILEFLATREVVIVLIILGLIIAVYVVLWFIEYMKKHEEKNTLVACSCKKLQHFFYNALFN